ncbi:MAG: DJ-1/PfpI family protein [Eubacteriales bacterium]|nr:DJ-1/PfpI family protein [Eubacteriales bacterium]
MKKAAVLLADGFEEIEALTVVDLLRRARVYVDTISITEEYMVHGAHGINVQTEDLFDEVNFVEFDMVVLPGGMPGTTNLNEHSGVRRVVKDFAESGKYVAAICAAPSILGGLGLLKGKRAACYPSVEDKLPGAVIVKAPVVQDGNIITSRGMGTAIDFSLRLVEILMDRVKADELAESIVYLK